MQREMEETIAVKPERHPLIRATGGFRRARGRRPGGGKSGGVRVIYLTHAKKTSSRKSPRKSLQRPHVEAEKGGEIRL